MRRLPRKCIIDANIPILANLVKSPKLQSDVPFPCIMACVEAIEHVIENGKLVLDEQGEIFDEYRRHLSLKGQPGVGDQFVKWIHDHQWSEAWVDRVSLIKRGVSYYEFSNHPDLTHFDDADRKFVAVANAHPEKPPILQAADSKWWGWKTALKEAGIDVVFLCQDYIEEKYNTKMVK